jgi:hypothetical protein
MVTAPQLPAPLADLPVQAHLALLLNPFYPKDPRASFGKHVLTPSLALTSIAAATPAHWQVRYWDENLLQAHLLVTPYRMLWGSRYISPSPGARTSSPRGIAARVRS